MDPRHLHNLGWVYPPHGGPAHDDKKDTVTTLENDPNAALLVVDLQNGVVSGNHKPRRSGGEYRDHFPEKH